MIPEVSAEMLQATMELISDEALMLLFKGVVKLAYSIGIVIEKHKIHTGNHADETLAVTSPAALDACRAHGSKLRFEVNDPAWSEAVCSFDSESMKRTCVDLFPELNTNDSIPGGCPIVEV